MLATLFDALAIGLSGVALWLVGTVVFDAIHALLHVMLRSRSALLRALAWPHGVHHRWLDRELRTNWPLQRANAFCHLVPEYLTQLAFSGTLFLLLPPAPIWVCMALQTGLFAFLLSQRGLDVNHRQREIVDAYRPFLGCPPDYHALHHVFPDAYYSAYTKVVDQMLGSAACLAGRHTALHGCDTPLGRALAAALREANATGLHAIDRVEDAAREDLDLLVLCDAGASPVPFVEAFCQATRRRLLPPEVWAVHLRADDPTARHYARDPRVSYRVLHAPDPGSLSAGDAARAAQRALFLARRGGHFLPLCAGALAAWRAWRLHRSTAPERPASAPEVRSRRALAA